MESLLYTGVRLFHTDSNQHSTFKYVPATRSLTWLDQECSILEFKGVRKSSSGLTVHYGQQKSFSVKGDENFDYFVRVISTLCNKAVRSLFDQLANSRGFIDSQVFKDFLINTQNIGTLFGSAISIDEIAEQVNAKFMNEESEGIDYIGFCHYLHSDIYNPGIRVGPQDMDRPFNEYYISSSHNTYLIGRQLAGVSSVEPYIAVLKSGCRCVEIDVWDDDDVPVVNHGRTFTSSVTFENVIKAINEHAFVASKMPVILSFEIHCNFENQIRMVEIMTRIFGEKLITGHLMTNMLSLPSPLELQNRIIVKVKPGRNKSGRSGSANLGLSLSASLGTNSSDDSSSTTSSSTDYEVTPVTSNSALGEEQRNKTLVKYNRKDANKCKIADELGDLGVYCQGVKFTNFSLPISKVTNHCFSLSEGVINKMLSKEGEESGIKDQLYKHNKKYLLRTYPSGYRVNSSNYNPIPYWECGVQMAALNWQNKDDGRLINDAMFIENGDFTGFIQKNPKSDKPDSLITLEVEFYSGFEKNYLYESEDEIAYIDNNDKIGIILELAKPDENEPQETHFWSKRRKEKEHEKLLDIENILSLPSKKGSKIKKQFIRSKAGLVFLKFLFFDSKNELFSFEYLRLNYFLNLNSGFRFLRLKKFELFLKIKITESAVEGKDIKW